MAWTAPRTWVAGEVPTASIFNTHVRDNFLETAVAKVTTAGDTIWATAANALARVPARIYKSADQTVNNSTTLANDTHLILPLAANEIWAFHYHLFITNASGSPGFKVALTVPAGATGTLGTHQGAAASDIGVMTLTGFMTTTITNSIGVIALASYTEAWVELKGYVINAGSSGNLTLQWAQNSAVASNTILLKGSHLIPTRLA